MTSYAVTERASAHSEYVQNKTYVVHDEVGHDSVIWGVLLQVSDFKKKKNQDIFGMKYLVTNSEVLPPSEFSEITQGRNVLSGIDRL
ncbi:hypothetical protein [Acetobacter persici]|uniref:hypothetical protein n=1 Tax=Acetobacter persici TaxID=1076596 RepID=UPI0039ED009D